MYEHKGRDLWLRWVLANAVGAVGGTLAGTLISMPFFFFLPYLGLVLAFLVGWVAFLIAVSWAQQAALWPYSDLAWLRNSISGGVAGILVGILVGIFVDSFVSSLAGSFAGARDMLALLVWFLPRVLGGLVIGLAQWPVLRDELHTSYARTWMWVPANAVAWAVGMAVAQAAYTFMFGPQGLDVPSEQQFLDFLLGLVVNPLARAMIAVALAAAITGGALLWIQRQRQASVGG